MVARNGTSPNTLAAIQRRLWSNVKFILRLIGLCIYRLFETSVREAALEAIPQSKKSLKIAVPWWNKQCDIAVKNKNTLFQEWNALGFYVILSLSFSNDAEQRFGGLY